MKTGILNLEPGPSQAPTRIQIISTNANSKVVRAAGLEPARDLLPTDFKSVAATITPRPHGWPHRRGAES